MCRSGASQIWIPQSRRHEEYQRPGSKLEGMLDQVLDYQLKINKAIGLHTLDSAGLEPSEDLPIAEERIPTTKVQNSRTKKERQADIAHFSESHLMKSQRFRDEPLLGLFKDGEEGENRP